MFVIYWTAEDKQGDMHMGSFATEADAESALESAKAELMSQAHEDVDGVDQIGFQLQCYMANKLLAPTYHSLSGSNWYSNENGHYRDISHLNPMRRELALRKPMSGGYGEDHRWADAMRGLVKTEHYVDKILYHYIARSRKDDRKDFNDPWRLQMIEKLRPALRTV